MEQTLAMVIIKKMLRVNGLHKSLIDKHAKGENIHRNQHLLLVYLSRCAAPLSQKDMADRLRISPAAVTDAVKKLEKLGLVARTPSPSDTRVKLISLTEKGLQQMEENRQIFAQTDRAMIEGIPEEDLAVFSGMLDKMTENLIKLGAADACPACYGLKREDTGREHDA